MVARTSSPPSPYAYSPRRRFAVSPKSNPANRSASMSTSPSAPSLALYATEASPLNSPRGSQSHIFSPRMAGEASPRTHATEPAMALFAEGLSYGPNLSFLQLACSYLLKAVPANPEGLMAPPDALCLRAMAQSVAANPFEVLQATEAELPCMVALLLSFLNSLSPPLLVLPHLPTSAWIGLGQIIDQDFQRTAMQAAVVALAPPYREAARHLFTTFSSIAQLCPEQTPNLVFLFAGAVLRDSLEHEMTGVVRINLRDLHRVVQSLIVHTPAIFAGLEASSEATSSSPPLVLPYQFDYKAGGILASAPLDRAVDFLLDAVYCDNDTHYVDAFLFTRSYFVSATDLLLRFWKIYAASASGLAWHGRIRARVLLLLRKWLYEYSDELEGAPKSFLAVLATFIHLPNAVFAASLVSEALEAARAKALEQHDSYCWKCLHSDASLPDGPLTEATKDDSLPFLHVYALKLWQRASTKHQRLVRNISYFYEKKVRQDHRPLLSLLMQTNAIEIAKALTLVDHNLFKAIPSHEFLSTNFLNPEHAPQFANMAERFNSMGRWIASEIVLQVDSQERVATLELAIQIAQHCLDQRNFNTCFAILAGLNSAAVSRLRNTWDNLTKKTRAIYERLFALFSMSNNFGLYRKKYQNAPLPRVPYLMLIPKDLIAIEDNNATLLQTGATNFRKIRLLWSVFSNIRQTQQAVYPFRRNPNLHVILSNLHCLSEDELWERSRSVEK